MYDTSIMHGHSGTSVYFLVWYGSHIVQAKTTLVYDIH
jgi:hypothetical protein